MIQCEKCLLWYHYSCINFPGSLHKPNVRYICFYCEIKCNENIRYLEDKRTNKIVQNFSIDETIETIELSFFHMVKEN